MITSPFSDISFENSTPSKIVYAPNGKSTRNASIASFPSVFYNGVYYDKGTFDLSTLEDYEGTVTLIKTSSSGNYDIINNELVNLNQNNENIEKFKYENRNGSEQKLEGIINKDHKYAIIEDSIRTLKK